MNYKNFPIGPLQTNAIIVYSDDKQALLIDPSAESVDMLDFISENNLKIAGCVATHSHADHIYEIQFYADKFSIPIYMHEGAEKIKEFYTDACAMVGLAPNKFPEDYIHLNKMKQLEVGTEKLQIITTPGHSPCGISLVADDFLIVGDLIFKGSIGRYDLPGSSLPVLYNSLKKIIALKKDYTILPGHGPNTQLLEEKETNQYLMVAGNQK